MALVLGQLTTPLAIATIITIILFSLVLMAVPELAIWLPSIARQ